MTVCPGSALNAGSSFAATLSATGALTWASFCFLVAGFLDAEAGLARFSASVAR